MTAPLEEIFYSIQGEGFLAGAPFLFVRLSGCNIRCAFCDTPAALRKSAEVRIIRSGGIETCPNPVSAEQAAEIIRGFRAKRVSFTGGEPMLHAEWIEKVIELLPECYFLMETNSTLAKSVTPALIERIDEWSADIKLPTPTGLDCMGLHREFYSALKGSKKLTLKAVHTPETPLSEIKLAFSLAKEYSHCAASLGLILQPATIEGPQGSHADVGPYFETLCRMAEEAPFEVRILPQIHRFLRVQ